MILTSRYGPAARALHNPTRDTSTLYDDQGDVVKRKQDIYQYELSIPERHKSEYTLTDTLQGIKRLPDEPSP